MKKFFVNMAKAAGNIANATGNAVAQWAATMILLEVVVIPVFMCLAPFMALALWSEHVGIITAAQIEGVINGLGWACFYGLMTVLLGGALIGIALGVGVVREMVEAK